MPDNSISNKRIARNTIFLYIRMGVVLLISLYTVRVALEMLGVEDYGIYNVICGFVSMFAVFNTAFSSSISRFFNNAIGLNNDSLITDVYNSAFRIQLLLAVIVLAVIEIVGIWYINSKMVLPPERMTIANCIFQFSAFSLVLTILQAPYSSIIIAHEQMDYYALVSVTASVLDLLNVISLMFLPGDRLLLYGILRLAVSVMSFLMYFIFAKKKYVNLKLKKNTQKELFKSMLSFSGWSLLDPIAYTMRGQGCNMVLNLFFGPVVNAAYALANQIANALDQFSMNVSTSFAPQIMQTYSAKDYDRTVNLTCSLAKINYILQMMLSVPLILEMNYVLGLWLGDTIPEHAIPFAIAIIIVKTINNLQGPLTKVTLATGRVRNYMVFASILVAMTLPVGYVLLRLGYAPESLFIGMIVLTVINLFVCLFITSRNFPQLSFSYYVRHIILPCLVFSFLLICIDVIPSLFMKENFGRLTLTCMISIVSTLSLSWLFLLDENERIYVKKLIDKLLLRR